MSGTKQKLERAILRRNWEETKRLLSQHREASVGAPSEDPIVVPIRLTFEALSSAAQYCNDPSVWTLIINHPDFGLIEETDFILEKALQEKNYYALKVLLEMGSNLTAKTLNLAAEYCREPELWELISRNLRFDQFKNPASSRGGATPLERAIEARNEVGMRCLIQQGVSLTAKALSAGFEEDQEAKILELIINHSEFDSLIKIPLDRPLGNKILEKMLKQKNYVIAKQLLEKGIALSSDILGLIAETCDDISFWTDLQSHQDFDRVMDVSNAKGKFPLERAIQGNNSLVAISLLERGVNLRSVALYNAATKCRDLVLWEKIAGAKHPEFVSFVRVALHARNEVAIIFLLLKGARFPEKKLFDKFPDWEPYIVQVFLDFELGLVTPFVQSPKDFAELIARAFPSDKKDFLSVHGRLANQGTIVRHLWLSLIDNGDLAALASSPHRPQVPWLASQVRAAGAFNSKATEAILSQAHHATIEEQAWAFIALFRMDSDGFVKKLLSPEAGAFREKFSRETLKKIRILVSKEEFRRMYMPDIFGISTPEKSLLVLQSKFEDKDFTQAESYSDAVLLLGNQWKDLKGILDSDLQTEMLKTLVDVLAWVQSLLRRSSSCFPFLLLNKESMVLEVLCEGIFETAGETEQLKEDVKQLKEDVWTALGLLTIGEAAANDVLELGISDECKTIVASKVFELLTRSAPTSVSFSVAPLSDDANRIARVLLQALGKAVPVEKITTLEQFKALLLEAVDEAKAAGEAKDALP